MDAQIIEAIITGTLGVIGAAAVPIVSRLMTREPEQTPTPANPYGSRRLRGFVLMFVFGVVGGAVGYLGVSPLVVSPCPPFAASSVSIAFPTAGSQVPRVVMVQGRACHIHEGQALWLLVVPAGVGAYYPQNGPITVGDGGTWSGSAFVGLDGSVDVGREFVVVAALAGEQGEAAIRRYFSQSGPEYRGLEPLPQGVRLMAQVAVVRK